MIKILALICTVIGLICLWFITQQIGLTPLLMVCALAIIGLAALCFWSLLLSPNKSHAQQASNTITQASNELSRHHNSLFKPLALLSLADKQQLLETYIDLQQLIETKQTFEQCCAWQFNDPENFDCLNLCKDVEPLTSLNVIEGKATLKSEMDQRNIAKAWQQLLNIETSEVVECQYNVLDAQGKSVAIIELWLLTQGERTVWYRAIGLVSAQGAKVAANASGQMMVEKGKMQALIRFADGIVHDYNNLFGIVNGYTELMTAVMDDSEKMSHYLEQIQLASARAEALSDQILALSRRRKSGMKLVDFEQIMIEPLFIFKKNLPDTVKFDWVLGKSHHQIKLDPSKLEEVLFAIGENAITAMDAKGTLRIISDITTLSAQKAASLALTAGDYLCFSVIDNGCGMDNEELTRAIEPYYSTSGSGGFGLASVYGFMKNCDGALAIDSSKGQGTRVSLYFPLVIDSQ